MDSLINGKDAKLKKLLMMVRIREAENLIAKDFFDNKIFSFLHLSVGQEASAVGVCGSLTREDYALGNHRSHGHYLAKGGSLEKMLLEIYGHPGGCCGGYGGSMHMLDRSVGFMGSTPILGSILPITAGMAFNHKRSGKRAVAVCFVGDGAAEEGSFYETVNIAARFELPLIVVIEDNLYAVNTPHEDRKSSKFDYEKIVSGFGANYLRRDGQNVEEVTSGLSELKSGALDGVPGILHLDVLREYAHSGPIKDSSATYRTDSESYRDDKDCIKTFASALIDKAGFSDEDIETAVEEEKTRTRSIFGKTRQEIKSVVGL